MKFAPIVLFVYNRPRHTQQTVEALRKNLLAKDSKLFIFSDGTKDEKNGKKVDEVREYLQKINGFKKITIIKRKNNLGLANSIIAGVTEIVNKHGKIIVLEDDLLSSPYFLQFMNKGLNFYEKEKRVASIHGYVYPVKNKLPETFFLKDPGCWGWATWKRAWKLFENDGRKLLMELNKKNLTSEFNYNNSYPFTNMLEDQINQRVDSWAIRWYASVFLKNKLTLYPGISLVFHNGDDESGVNSGISNKFNVKLSKRPVKIGDARIKENPFALKGYIKYFRSIQPPLILRVGKSALRRLYKLLIHKNDLLIF